jgi:hypothetical protein
MTERERINWIFSFFSKLFNWIFIWLIEIFISRISIWFYFQNFYNFIEFLFHVLSCLLYFIQLFEFSWNSFRHFFMSSNFIDHSCNHFLKLILWGFIHFTIIRICFCGVIECWRSHVAFPPPPYFSCFCLEICTSEAKSLVEVLITYDLSVEIVSMSGRTV